MGVHFNVTGIDHEPLKIRFINEGFQQRFPEPFVAPATKAPMGVLPVSIVRWQIPPWRARAQNPENGVDKGAIITRPTTLSAFATGQMGF